MATARVRRSSSILNLEAVGEEAAALAIVGAGRTGAATRPPFLRSSSSSSRKRDFWVVPLTRAAGEEKDMEGATGAAEEEDRRWRVSTSRKRLPVDSVCVGEKCVWERKDWSEGWSRGVMSELGLEGGWGRVMTLGVRGGMGLTWCRGEGHRGGCRRGRGTALAGVNLTEPRRCRDWGMEGRGGIRRWLAGCRGGVGVENGDEPGAEEEKDIGAEADA